MIDPALVCLISGRWQACRPLRILSCPYRTRLLSHLAVHGDKLCVGNPL